MASLSENDITSQFIGHTVSMDRLTKCARRNRPTANGDEYIVYSCGFLYNRELRELFGVTEQLKELWERRGTEFNLHLYINEGKITSCQISKYHEGDGARPTYRSLKCTQQDLHIAQRILQYVTEQF